MPATARISAIAAAHCATFFQGSFFQCNDRTGLSSFTGRSSMISGENVTLGCLPAACQFVRSLGPGTASTCTRQAGRDLRSRDQCKKQKSCRQHAFRSLWGGETETDLCSQIAEHLSTISLFVRRVVICAIARGKV